MLTKVITNKARIVRALTLGMGGAALLSACAAADGSVDGEELGALDQAVVGTLQIYGRVTSPTGAPLAGVTVKLTGGATKTTTTDAVGKYGFTSLGSGAYTVTPSKTGLAFCSSSASLPKLRQDTVEHFTGSPGGCQAAVITRKVTALIYDPTFTRPDGTTAKLSAYQGWSDPGQLAERLRRSIESTTNGRVRYNIVKTKVLNDIPAKLDGFDYNQASYLACLNDPDHSDCHGVDTPSYLNILSGQGVCSDVNAGTTDELWLFGGPWFGFWESQLTGPGAFQYNSPPLEGSTCNKLLPMMGFNYERGLEEMVHNLLHRTEATMSKVYTDWQEDRMVTSWDKFGLIDAQSPNFAFSGCGSAHWAPNSTSDYDYENPGSVQSYCDDFFNYPNLKAPQNALKTVTCNDWGCNELGYYKYFFQRLPKASGVGGDGKLNDWWKYVMNPNEIASTVPTITCSSEYDAGWCQSVKDNHYGACNEGEWATAGVSSGWVKIAFPIAASVSSVKIYDRACDEQVLSGRVQLSDGSSFSFGALENSGTTPTTVSFSKRTVSWVKVLIDSSTGTNPGIGEIITQ